MVGAKIIIHRLYLMKTQLLCPLGPGDIRDFRVGFYELQHYIRKDHTPEIDTPTQGQDCDVGGA